MASDQFSPAISLVANPEQIRQITADLADVRNGVARAIAPAINKTLAKGQTTLIDGLTKRLAAKRGNILGKKDNRRVVVVKASQNNLTGRIKIKSRSIGLIIFDVVDTRTGATSSKKGRRQKGWNKKGSGQGVTARVFKDEPPVAFPKAFIAVGLSDNRHVFERFGVGIGGKGKGGKHRQDKAHYRPNIGRLTESLRSFKGISLLTVWKETPSLRRDVNARITDEFPKDIMSQVDRLLDRKKST